MNITGPELLAEYRRAIGALPWMHDADVLYELPPYTLAAVGSREVNWDLDYLSGKLGDGGYAYGPWQLDLHPQNYTAERKAACDRIKAGDMHLAAAWAGNQLHGGFLRCGSWVGSFNAYNSGGCSTGGTAGHDYGPDVEDRRHWLLANLGLPRPKRRREDDEP